MITTAVLLPEQCNIILNFTLSLPSAGITLANRPSASKPMVNVHVL